MAYTLVLYRPSHTEYCGGYVEGSSESSMELVVTDSLQKAKLELVKALVENLHHTSITSKKYRSAVGHLEPKFGINGFFGFDDFNDCPPRLGSILYQQDAFIKDFIREAYEEAEAQFSTEIKNHQEEEAERKRLAVLESHAASEESERELLRQLKEKYEK